MDPLQWMGAVRMRMQTANKNITIIQVINTTPVHQLTSCEGKSYAVVKQIQLLSVASGHNMSPYL